MKEHIPTILDEEGLATLELHPTEAEIEAVFYRLHGTDLPVGLKKIDVDFKELLHLIAVNLQHKEAWDRGHKEKDRADDNATKTQKRWKQPPGNRQSRIKKATRIVTRELFADDSLETLAPDKTKRRPYLSKFLYQLVVLFYGKTARPFSYIAALFLLFDFNGEKFCDDCSLYGKPKDRTEEKRAKKIAKLNNEIDLLRKKFLKSTYTSKREQYENEITRLKDDLEKLSEKTNEKKFECNKKKLFKCEKHRQARDKIHRMFAEAFPEVPSINIRTE